MIKAKPKPKPKAKPAAKGGTSPPAPKAAKVPKRRELTKTLVLQILLAKLEASKTCDWYALSQRLGGDDGGKEFTGTELHELYHNVVLPGLKHGRALWTDDDEGMHFPDREDEDGVPTPLRVSPRTRATGREGVGTPDPWTNDEHECHGCIIYDGVDEGEFVGDDDPMDAASPSRSDASWHSEPTSSAPSPGLDSATGTRSSPSPSSSSRKRKSPADKPQQRKRMQTKRESHAAAAARNKKNKGRRKSFGA